MKKNIITLIMAAIMAVSLAACGSDEIVSDNRANDTENYGSTMESDTQNESKESEMNRKKVASDDAQMQTEDKTMPTRVIEKGTKINMHFGDTVIPGILNDSETALALIEKLPYTVHVSRYSHDFCGRIEELPYNEDDVHFGWLNGDIDYAIDAPWFTILFGDEENSEQNDYQVNIGVITCPLSEISNLEGSYDVLIELAE